MAKTHFTAVLEKAGDLYVALCREVNVASQGTTVEEAIGNLKEAVARFLASADPREIRERRIDAGSLLSIVAEESPPP
jgi:predicted RNase H-like HicB family nuclease